MSKYKSVLRAFLVVTIAFALFHFLLLTGSSEQIHTDSFILVLLPYGFPILMASLTCREANEDRIAWRKGGFVMATLFAIAYLGMVAHVTIACLMQKESYVNIYFNVPLYYLVPMFVFAILWGTMKKNSLVDIKNEKKTVVGKALSVLPMLLLVAMFVHAGIVAVIDIVRQYGSAIPSTSAPWLVMPLVVSLAYIVAIGLALLLKGIYQYVKNRK